MSFNLRAPQSIPTMSRSPYAPSFRRNRQLPSPLLLSPLLSPTPPAPPHIEPHEPAFTLSPYLSLTLGHHERSLIVVVKALHDELRFYDVAFRGQEIVQAGEGVDAEARR